MTSADIGLALSGGGYRAALFHIGGLWRLNELGLLGKLREVSSVSGGSIAAALLGLRWKRLAFDGAGVAQGFVAEFVTPLRTFCRRTVDVSTILGGLLHPWRRPCDLLAAAYDRHLFGGATLQDLPADGEGPRFTIYATSLQTGASVRFSRAYLGEYHLGTVPAPAIPLALAVTASSAFPPFYVPVELRLDPSSWRREEGADLHDDEALRSCLLLGDGGIYDNLGLERIAGREVVLVSDAGAPFRVAARSWALSASLLARVKRVLDVTTTQTRALRTRHLVREFREGRRRGAYWGIETQLASYGLAAAGRAGPLTADCAATAAQASVRTRLDRFDDSEQGRLVNWGYAVADAALRRFLVGDEGPPPRWPVPEAAF